MRASGALVGAPLPTSTKPVPVYGPPNNEAWAAELPSLEPDPVQRPHPRKKT